MMKNFIGLSGYVWWYGVVESRADPLFLGRARIRVHGWHTSDKSLLPTEDLPWAHGAYAIDNTSPVPPKEGSIVQGYFIDGENAQFPVFTHVLPGIPEETGPIDKGFSDQRTDDELTNSPRPPKKITYNTDGSGVEIEEEDKAKRYPFILNEPTTSRLARNEETDKTIVNQKKDSRAKKNDTASGTKWDEPEVPYDAQYPYNRVTETEAGHLLEFDDTPGAERVHLYHRSGSFIEMHPNGDVVLKDAKNKYEIILADEKIVIMGDSTITVNGDAMFLVKGDNNIKIEGDLSAIIEGDADLTISGDATATVTGKVDIFSLSRIHINAPRVDINRKHF